MAIFARSLSLPPFFLYTTPTHTHFCHRRANLLASGLASIIHPPQACLYVARNTSYSRRVERAYGECPSACHPLLQGFNVEVATGCFPLFYFVFRFQRWSRSVELALLFTGQYISRGKARPHPPQVRMRPAPRAGPKQNPNRLPPWFSW